MKFIKVIAMMAILLTATSCGTLTKSRSLAFDEVRLELGMNNLEYLGDQEISVEYTSYLGLFKSIEKVNGEVYNPVIKRTLTMPRSCKFSNANLEVAAYKLVETYPEAVFFQVVFETKTTDKLFLGSTNKLSARVKAYKLKN